MATTRRPRIQALAEDASVTPLELFFDLVFVYALTQVTQLMAVQPSGLSVARGMVVLALVWWCWVGYSWLGNALQADEGATRIAFFAVMATMFVAALAIPESFDDLPGGLSGPMTLAVCYAIVRTVHLGVFAAAARSSSDRGLLRQLAAFGLVMVGSIVLVIVGALLEDEWQLGLWIAAMGIDYVGTQAIGATGWRLRSPGHFSERHGLIIIIALGESIVSIGAGVTENPVSWPVIFASAAGIALSAAMWWIYFDVSALGAERRLMNAVGVDQTRMARDAYTYLHLPMVAGIVLGALGLKKVLGYVAGDDGHSWTDSLHGVPPVALHVGVALFVLALVAFRLRIVGSVSRTRLPAGLVLLATIPLASRIGALADLLLVTGIMVALISVEATRYAEDRHRIRHLEHHAAD